MNLIVILKLISLFIGIWFGSLMYVRASKVMKLYQMHLFLFTGSIFTFLVIQFKLYQ